MKSRESGMAQWWERSLPTSAAQRVRFRPGTICGLSLLLAPALLWECFTSLSGFPPSTKTNISKFQFCQDRRPTRKPAKVAMWLLLLILYFITLVQFYFCSHCLFLSFISCYFCHALQMFNSRTCQLVLGAGALQLVGLKTITAKHLGTSVV